MRNQRVAGLNKEASPATAVKLSLWERVCLIIQKDGERTELVSRIEGIKQGSLVLEMPIRQNGTLNLSKGDIVEVSYDKADSVYTFKASILDLFQDDGTVEIKRTSAATRAQSRKYFRIDISGDITFRKLDDEGGLKSMFGPETSGTLLNISAGGLLFEYKGRLKDNSLILLSLSLKNRHALKNILAIVKRCEGSKSEGYLIGAEFITRSNFKEHGLDRLDEFLPSGCGTFDENLQKLVMRFIYDQQIESKKKSRT